MIVIAFLVLCLCWSTTWQAIRMCLEGYPPLLGAALRFALATGLLASAVLVQGALRARRERGSWQGMLGPLGLRGGRGQHLAIAAAGVVNGLGYACVYLAEQKLSGGTTAVICASSPLFTLLIARLMRLEPVVPGRLLGTMLGLFGVFALFADGEQLGRGHLYAMLLAMCAAAVLWPLYGALLKRYAQDVPPLLSTSYFLLYTALSLAVLSLWRAEPMLSVALLRAAPPAAHAGLLYLALVGSVLAWTVYVWLLQRMDLSVLSTLGLIQPVLALAIDLLAGEAQLRLRGYIGATLVVLGMGLSVLASSRLGARAPRLPDAEPGPPGGTGA